MVGVDRIVGGAQGPANLAQARSYAPSAEMDVQTTDYVTGREVASDGAKRTIEAVEVSFSDKAQKLSNAARLFQESEAQTETQTERVKQVREAIANGAHRVQQVVLAVAARVATTLQATSTAQVPKA